MKKLLLSIIFLITCFISNLLLASNHDLFYKASRKGLERQDVENILRNTTALSYEEITALVDKLINAYKCKPGARIPISGVLSTSGLNSAFFLDTGDWAMNVSVIDPDTNKIITIPNLFSAHFENGGFKIELSYNWIFVFIPADISVQSLNNAIYGRGITLSFSPLFGLETGWTPGNNRPGSLFYGSFKMGIAGGISFPKIKFEMNKIYQ